jgi:hypothetical protein
MFELMLARAAVDAREREAGKYAWRWRLREMLMEDAARESRASRPPALPARSVPPSAVRCCGLGA